MRTQTTRDLLHQMEREAIVLLENNNNTLPLSTSIGSIALIGPQVDRVTVCDLSALASSPFLIALLVRRLCLLQCDK